jgi:hypothetical protein
LNELEEPIEPIEPIELGEPPVSLYAENPPSIKNTSELTPHNKLRGGSSLYSSLSQSAYTLAPTAALLGMATYLMSTKHSKSLKRRKNTRNSIRRKTTRRRKYKY